MLAGAHALMHYIDTHSYILFRFELSRQTAELKQAFERSSHLETDETGHTPSINRVFTQWEDILSLISQWEKPDSVFIFHNTSN